MPRLIKDKMMNEYLETWQSIFRLNEPLSRRTFWIFIGINYLSCLLLSGISELFHNHNLEILLIFIAILFGFSSILAIIRVLNQRKIINDNNEIIIEPLMKYSDFIKSLLLSIIIGVLNFLFAFTAKASLNMSYILIVFCVCIIPFSFALFLITVAILKKKVTNQFFIIYFIFFLVFTLILQLLLSQMD